MDFKTIVTMKKNGHKGENGKILIIADSDLFHAPGLWAAELMAHFVDMVFYYPPNDTQGLLAKRALRRFRNGIIIPHHQLKNYIAETDVILMGPGIRRDQKKVTSFINTLLTRYSHKKWVLDAGALQVMKIENITDSMILTPHRFELKRFINCEASKTEEASKELISKYFGTWLVKSGNGIDWVCSRSAPTQIIKGGNEGLTKGGTGDLLAALTAVFYVHNSPEHSAAYASFILKKAAESLYKKTGPYFTTTELLACIPQTVWKLQSKR